MDKILTIGGATQDVFLSFGKTDFMSLIKHDAVSSYLMFESGEKLEVDGLNLLTGGGSTNSATSFKRLGFDSASFCNLGKDCYGNAVLEDLQKEGIDTSFVNLTDEHNTGVSFILNTPRGDRTILAYRGANGFLSLEKLTVNAIKKCKQLYITSLSNDSAKLLPEISKIAKQANVPIAINPGISQLAKGMRTLRESLKYIDILILNSSEAQTFMLALVELDEEYKKVLESNPSQNPCSINTQDEDPYLMHAPIAYENFYFRLSRFFKEALDLGPKIVVVTNGCNGVYVATDKDNVLFHPSIKTKVTCTVGAGDAFGSCFVASLLLGDSVEQALKNGMINSSSVLGSLGAKAGLLGLEELRSRAGKIDKGLMQYIKI